jgi:hypothetical protein
MKWAIFTIPQVTKVHKSVGGGGASSTGIKQ